MPPQQKKSNDKANKGQKNKTKGLAAKRRGKAYRVSRSKRRRKVNDFDPDNPEGNIRFEERQKQQQLRKGLNSAPTVKAEKFVSRNFKNLMAQMEQLKQEDKKENTTVTSGKKRKKSQSATESEVIEQPATVSQTKNEQNEKKIHHREKQKQQQQEFLKKTQAAQKKQEDMENLVDQGKMTKRKMKSKLWAQMKREKKGLTKIKKEIRALTASETKGSKRKRKTNDVVLDDEDDVVDDDDLLNISDDEDDLDELRQDIVEFGEVAQEPPKKLKKLQEKLSKKLKRNKDKKEDTRTLEEKQQEANRERLLEIERQRVLKNYDSARQKRIGGTVDTESQKWQAFAGAGGSSDSTF
jgi:hypothetical protein